MVVLRTAASVKEEDRAASRVRDRNAVSSREEEETAEMEDLRERKQAAFREVADRVRIALRVIGAVRVLARAAGEVSAVASATAEQLEDREVDSETADRVRALLLKLRQRIQKSGVTMKRGAQAIRREISDPERIIFMKRTRRQKTVPADSLSLKRRRRKLSRR